MNYWSEQSLLLKFPHIFYYILRNNASTNLTSSSVLFTRRVGQVFSIIFSYILERKPIVGQPFHIQHPRILGRSNRWMLFKYYRELNMKLIEIKKIKCVCENDSSHKNEIGLDFVLIKNGVPICLGIQCITQNLSKLSSYWLLVGPLLIDAADSTQHSLNWYHQFNWLLKLFLAYYIL